MLEKFIPPISKSFSFLPLSNIKKLELDASPKPRISIVELIPSIPEYKLLTWMPE